MEGLHKKVADLAAEIEFFEEEAKRATDEVMGQGVQASFRVFC